MRVPALSSIRGVVRPQTVWLSVPNAPYWGPETRPSHRSGHPHVQVPVLVCSPTVNRRKSAVELVMLLESCHDPRGSAAVKVDLMRRSR